MSPITKTQPWKAFPRDAAAGSAAAELTREEMDLQRSYGTHASNTKGRIFTVEKAQPWKSFPRDGAAAEAVELTPEEMDLQRSYGTHASNTKGRIFTVDKAQPWKRDWPAAGDKVKDLTEEELNMQRSYGTHASNTKGRIFTVEKPASKSSLSFSAVDECALLRRCTLGNIDADTKCDH